MTPIQHQSELITANDPKELTFRTYIQNLTWLNSNGVDLR